jgi:hypothetical protein
MTKRWSDPKEAKEELHLLSYTADVTGQLRIIKIPVMIASDSYLWAEELDGTEAWRLGQYGLILAEKDVDNPRYNSIEWRRNSAALTVAEILEYSDTSDTWLVLRLAGQIDQPTAVGGIILHARATNEANADPNDSSAAIQIVGSYGANPQILLRFQANLGETGTPFEAIYDIAAHAPKLAFFGATPAAKASNTADLKDALVAYGLIVDGAATPLNLDGAKLSAGLLNLPESAPGAPTNGDFWVETAPTVVDLFAGMPWMPDIDSPSSPTLRYRSAGSTYQVQLTPV